MAVESLEVAGFGPFCQSLQFSNLSYILAFLKPTSLATFETHFQTHLLHRKSFDTNTLFSQKLWENESEEECI